MKRKLSAPHLTYDKRHRTEQNSQRLANREKDYHGEQSNNSQPSPAKRGQTFRVRGVPLGWTREELQAHLADKAAAQDDSAGTTVHSLAREIHGRSYTATITFENSLCEAQTLQAGKSWSIPLPIAPTTSGRPQSLALDKEFLGITTLYAPTPQDHKLDIVAISGLGGHAFGSFKERAGEHMWLRDALPFHLTEEGGVKPVARVMVYGYDSSLPMSNSFQGLDDLGTSFYSSLLSMATERTLRPIIFIAHSLGGLIVKESLILLSKSKNKDHQRLLEAVYGIVLFGVPNHGMDITSLKPMVQDGPNRALLESIGRNSSLLRRQHEDFQKALGSEGKSEVICFYETVESSTAIQVQNGEWKMAGPPAVLVDTQSATHCRTWEHNIYPINRTHSEIVKFGSHDEDYDRVVEQIKGLVRRAPSRGKSRLQPKLSQEERDCLQSLAFPQMYERANDIDPAAKGTCQWLLRHETYASWHSSDRGLLWIKGKPGSGKSTLLKYALDSQQAILSRSGSLVLSFFFHGRGDDLQRSPLGLFRSLVHQVLSQAPSAMSGLVDEFQRRLEQIGMPGQKWQWHEKELQDFFKSSLPKVIEDCPVWLFIDALDECGEKNAVNLFGWLKALLQSLSSTTPEFHICVTCRHYPILGQGCAFEICPEHENDADISIFVQGQLSASSKLAASPIPALITDRASGVFMWARLVVDQVLDLDNEGAGLKKIKKQISAIPSELDELYRTLIGGMSEKQISLKLIQWICFATRPLSLDELRWALIVDAKCPYKSLQQCQNDDEYDSDMEKRLNTLSRGLAEVIQSSDLRVVQFIHQSVKDFFVDKGLSALHGNMISANDPIGMAHYQLSRTCIRYLAMEEIGRLGTYKNDEMRRDFPLLHYATTSWVRHTKESDARGISQEDLLELFAWPSTVLVDLWKSVYDGLHKYQLVTPSAGSNLLHVVAKHQILGALLPILQDADQTATDIDLKDSSGRTPLAWAAEYGNEAVVKLLLDTGQASPNSKDSSGRTPLSSAAENGNEAVVNLLLKTRQAEVDSKDYGGLTPLAWAAGCWNEAVVKLLLDTGQASPNSKDSSGRTPLSYAAEDGNEAVVNLLLNTRQVEPDSKDSSGRTPLSYAAEDGNEAIVKLLLNTRQVEPDSKDSSGRTPLSYAAKDGNEAVVKLLLNTRQVEPDSKDSNGRTPLSWAAEDRNEAVVKLLLNTGQVEADSKDRTGRTPLDYAAESWRGESLVNLLKEYVRSDSSLSSI